MTANSPYDSGGNGFPPSPSDGFGDGTTGTTGGNDLGTYTGDPADNPGRGRVAIRNGETNPNLLVNGETSPATREGPSTVEQAPTPQDNGYTGNARLSKDALKKPFPWTLVIAAVVVTKLLKLW